MKTIEVGFVARPHGLAGELKVKLHWSESTALYAAGQVYLRQGDGLERPYVVRGARPHGRAVLLLLEGVASASDAEALRNARVAVARDELPEDAGEFYLVDLVGMAVICQGVQVGRVVEVRAHPTVDSILIERADGRRVEQPLSEPWLGSVDSAAARIELTSLDGMIE